MIITVHENVHENVSEALTVTSFGGGPCRVRVREALRACLTSTLFFLGPGPLRLLYCLVCLLGVTRMLATIEPITRLQ